MLKEKRPTGPKAQQTASHTAILAEAANDGKYWPSKQARVLRALMGPRGLNRFEAERLGDHALNSTVSSLGTRYWLAIRRTYERVPTRFGTLVRVKRYWLADCCRPRAERLLARWEAANDKEGPKCA